MSKYFIKGNPQFCAIAPTAYLEEYATQSNTHLVLAHLVATDPIYTQFYREMSERGDLIILDNSAFELGESFTPAMLIELGHKVLAHAIVCPDYPYQAASVTIDAARQWIPLFKQEGFDVFFVPQSNVGDLEDWIHCYDWASDNPNIDIIGMSILGIPNALPNVPKSYARVVMTELLRDRGVFNDDKYHHYLGSNAAINVEIPSLILRGCLDSCDSSNPIWCGINAIKYNTIYSDYMGIQKKYLREVDFNEKYTKKDHIHEIIQHNLDVTLDIFADPSKYL